MTTDKTEEIEKVIDIDFTDNPVQRYKDDIAIYKDMIARMFIKAVNEMRCFNFDNGGFVHKYTRIRFQLTLPKLGIEEFDLEVESERNPRRESWTGNLANNDEEVLLNLSAHFYL